MTGKDALAMFDPDEFDLVLLDIQLPDMTGLDIASQLKSRYQGRHMPPLIALTANVLKDKKEYQAAGMDDVLSKPLEIAALTQVIKTFWDHADSAAVVAPAEPAAVDKNRQVLDTAMLEQYLELVGLSLITQSLAMFEKMMPGYLVILDSNMTARDRQGIAEEGHKIKGAAGSVGLRHLQQLAQQIQNPELPAWWDNVQEWIDELKHEWRHDVQTLRDWVQLAEKK